jgi:uncharacterized membrane protein YfcA
LLWFLLGVIGLFVGAFGTLIGAAGGFILVPILLFLYPEDAPSAITSITLTVAFFNALSGSVAYSRLKRIDYRSGLIFAVPAVIGAIIGASITSLLSRNIFQIIFGAVLIIAAAYLLVRPIRNQTPSPAAGHTRRSITDRHGNFYSYSYSRVLGIFISLGVGLLSGLLGIGGGIIHVPLLTQVLNFPVHIATATSHFVVAISTFSAVITHIVTGEYASGVLRAVILSAGAIIGAQFGARVSHRVPAALVVRLLAAGLLAVAVRLLIASLS